MVRLTPVLVFAVLPLAGVAAAIAIVLWVPAGAVALGGVPLVTAGVAAWISPDGLPQRRALLGVLPATTVLMIVAFVVLIVALVPDDFHS